MVATRTHLLVLTFRIVIQGAWMTRILRALASLCFQQLGGVDSQTIARGRIVKTVSSNERVKSKPRRHAECTTGPNESSIEGKHPDRGSSMAVDFAGTRPGWGLTPTSGGDCAHRYEDPRTSMDRASHSGNMEQALFNRGYTLARNERSVAGIKVSDWLPDHNRLEASNAPSQES